MDRIRQLEEQFTFAQKQASLMRESNRALTRKMCDTTIQNERLHSEKTALEKLIDVEKQHKSTLETAQEEPVMQELRLRSEDHAKLQAAYNRLMADSLAREKEQKDAMEKMESLYKTVVQEKRQLTEVIAELQFSADK
jgi:hypothetical protein